jgi:predicted nucleic acid-binding protein
LDPPAADALVVDASALVELLLSTTLGEAVGGRIEACALHAPAHIDAEVLSVIGRLQRAGHLSEKEASARLRSLVDLSIERHPLPDLLLGAWRRRRNVALVDALYVELASRLQAPLITVDGHLARATRLAEVVS